VEQIPAGWGRCVLTIGVFDGVHRGHQALIRRAVDDGRELGLPVVLMTFDPHPSEVVRPGSHPAELTTLRRRAELVEELGVDVFFVLPFDLPTSHLSAEVFVHDVLVDRLHVAAVVVGENFHFGHRGAGNLALLTELGHRFGFTADGIGLVAEEAVTVSSTFVRACVDAGDVRAAAEALGRPHRLDGVVVHGRRTASPPAGSCWAPVGRRRPSRSVPTRRSPAGSAPSRRSCWTTAAISTAGGSASSSSNGSVRPRSSTRSTRWWNRSARTSSGPDRFSGFTEGLQLTWGQVLALRP
jgi:cytidyltransferase-like protein